MAMAMQLPSVRSVTLERVAVLINPRAGSGRAAGVGHRVVGELRQAGLQVQELVGSDARAAGRLVSQAAADGVDAVIACGGDGLVHLALQAVAETSTVLGVIPCGSGNDFAGSLGLPVRSTRAAIDLRRCRKRSAGARARFRSDSRRKVNDDQRVAHGRDRPGRGTPQPCGAALFAPMTGRRGGPSPDGCSAPRRGECLHRLRDGRSCCGAALPGR